MSYYAAQPTRLRRSALLMLFVPGAVAHGFGSVTSAAAYCAYVGNSESNLISVIDTATNTVVASIAEQCSFGRCDPSTLAITPDGRFLYVANEGTDEQPGNTVSVIDTATHRVASTVAVGVGPAFPAITPNGRFAYIPNAGFVESGKPGNTVSVIDTATALSDPSSAVIKTLQFDSTPLTVVFSPDSRLAYIATFSEDAGAVAVVDTATNTLQSTVPDNGGFLAITSRGDLLYGANPSNDTVVVTDTAKALTAPMQAKIATISVGTFPFDAAITPDGHFVYVVNCGQGCFDGAVSGSGISIIDTASNTVASTVPLPPKNDPLAVAITPDGRFAYVANSFSDTVTVIDAAKARTAPADAVVATVPVGPRPFDVVIASVPGGCAGTGTPCVGDCNGNGEVTVNELVVMVNVALDQQPSSACTAGDGNHDEAITVNEIVAGVKNALNGCSAG